MIPQLDNLQAELRQACKVNPSSTLLSLEGELSSVYKSLEICIFCLADETQSSVRTEGVCRALESLFRTYDLNIGAGLLQKYFS